MPGASTTEARSRFLTAGRPHLAALQLVQAALEHFPKAVPLIEVAGASILDKTGCRADCVLGQPIKLVLHIRAARHFHLKML